MSYDRVGIWDGTGMQLRGDSGLRVAGFSAML
jgi:hypothetical protein